MAKIRSGWLGFAFPRIEQNQSHPYNEGHSADEQGDQSVQDLQESRDLCFVVVHDVGRRSPLLRLVGQDSHGCEQAALGRMIELSIGLSKSQAYGLRSLLVLIWHS